MKKAIVCVLMVALVVAMGMTSVSCQKSEGKAASAGPVEIDWWVLSGGAGADDPRTEMNKRVAAEFEAANPNVKVNVNVFENEAFKQKIQLAIQAGDPPDLFHSWGGGVMVEYANQGQLTDITDYVKSTLSKKIGIGALGVYGYDGKYYGAPYDMGAVALWYNKDILAEVGIEVPKTWAELLTAVPKIKKAGYVPIALGAGDKWPAHFWWVYLAMRIGGIEAFNAAYGGSGSFKDETFVNAGKELQKLAMLQPFQTGFLSASYDDESRIFGDGKAAFELMGQWAPNVQANNSASGEGVKNLGVTTFPAVEGGKGALTDVMGGGNGYIVGANAPKETVEFLNYFLSVENQKEQVALEGIIPVVKGAETVLEGNTKAIAEAVGNAGYYQLYYDQFLPPAVGEAVKDAVAALLAGSATPAKAAAMVDDAWQMEK
ncbi:MAG: extracellular solute-binding protein [Spirochaetales bacterium]|nr:extracellular solute-binding protein [Spirochaetales bacterium]